MTDGQKKKKTLNKNLIKQSIWPTELSLGNHNFQYIKNTFDILNYSYDVVFFENFQ